MATWTGARPSCDTTSPARSTAATLPERSQIPDFKLGDIAAAWWQATGKRTRAPTEWKAKAQSSLLKQLQPFFAASP